MTDFTSQSSAELIFRGHRLVVPSRHPIIAWNTPGNPAAQPYRESGLIAVSRALKLVGKKGVVLDIGANIGDSMIVIAGGSGLPVHCVEASDFFFAYLTENIARHFPGQAVAQQAFVTGREDEPAKGLVHWGGTARPASTPFMEHCGALSIGAILRKFDEVALLKVDTDGNDQEIILGAFAAGSPERRFPLYFEFEITASEPEPARVLCQRAMGFFQHMSSLGYHTGFFWDDPGRYLGEFDIGQTGVLRNIINYMTHLRQRPVWGFDVCLIHQTDVALAQQLRTLISEGLMLP